MKVNFHYYKSEAALLGKDDKDLQGVVSFVGGPTRPAIYLGKTKYTLSDQDIKNIVNGVLPADLADQLAQIVTNKNDITSIKTQLTDYAKKTDLDNLTTKKEFKEFEKNTTNKLDYCSRIAGDYERNSPALMASAFKVDKVKLSGTNLVLGQTNANGKRLDDISVSLSSLIANAATKEDLKSINLFEVVKSLPATGVSNKIYLVADKTSTDTQNKYIEYAWINSKWEKVGEVTTKVDLSEYAKKSDLTNLATKDDLTSLATKSDLTSKADASNVYTKDQVDQKIADVQTGGSVDLSNYVTKTQLKAYATKAEVVDVKNIANGADTKATNAVSTANAAKNQANTNAGEITSIKSQLAGMQSASLEWGGNGFA